MIDMGAKKYESGQILLITLLVLTVVITIGVALIGRTRTDVTSSAEIEESARAFSAAEAGIEQALISGAGTQGEVTLSNNNASYTTNVSTIGSAQGAYAFSELTNVGDTETLWLVGHTPEGLLNESVKYTGASVDICWKGVSGGIPALAATVVYKTSGGLYRTAQRAFDPTGTRQNNFAAGGAVGNGCGQTGVYRQTILFSSFSPVINPASDTLLMLRLRPFYANAFLFADAGASTLPAQGRLISSEGSTETGITRRVVVSQQFRSPSGIFDAAVISQTNFSR